MNKSKNVWKALVKTTILFVRNMFLLPYPDQSPRSPSHYSSSSFLTPGVGTDGLGEAKKNIPVEKTQ